MKSDILVSFGQNVQKTRKRLGLSQEELAEKAGLHRTYIGMIERAEKNITLCNIEKIANALEIAIRDLFWSLYYLSVTKWIMLILVLPFNRWFVITIT